MNTLLEAARGLVWSVRCPGCGLLDVPICPRCRGAVAGPGYPVPLTGGPPGRPVFVACSYQGVPSKLIVAWKERGRLDLTKPLAAGLGAALGAFASDAGDSQSWVIVPVPSSAKARRERGADLMADLARRASASLGGSGSTAGSGPTGGSAVSGPRVVQGLRHRRRVADQSGLDVAGRRANLAGALTVRRRARRSLAGQKVVIVDDIVTTGATVAEAARALTSAGAQVVGICCLSVTLRRHRMPSEGYLH